MKYPKFLAATKSTEIVAAISGLPVNSDGFIVSEDEVANVEAALIAAETVGATVATLQASLDTANENLATAQAAQQTAETALTEANATIATHEARIAELEKLTPPAAQTPVKGEDEQRNNKVKANDMGFQKGLYEMI
jgi:paraquat-inducible protein B